jgi:dTDP-4-amino-4,6-dideoxygalactose transaminase
MTTSRTATRSGALGEHTLMAYRYQLSDVDMGEREAEAVADVVRSKWLSLGPRTAEFEHKFANHLNAQHAVAIANCTAALHLALVAVDVGPGDEVLLPSYTFVASANAVLYNRATPVFVDIVGPHDLNLDPDDLESKISPRTKAILVVHLAGYFADMDRIMQIARKHGLAVVEDACHAIGSRYEGSPGSAFAGRYAGTIGDAGCFSFFANKNLVTGEGGMLVTESEQIAERVRRARSHGMTKSSWDKAAGRATDYDVIDLGYNYRCTEITAALGMVQLTKLAGAHEQRRILAARYKELLADAPGITIPFEHRTEDSSNHIFPILVAEADERTTFRQQLQDHGIQTSVHYPPVHQFTHYRRLVGEPSLPRTVDAAAREVTLPMHPLLVEADIDAICASVLRALPLPTASA